MVKTFPLGWFPETRLLLFGLTNKAILDTHHPLRLRLHLLSIFLLLLTVSHQALEKENYTSRTKTDDKKLEWITSLFWSHTVSPLHICLCLHFIYVYHFSSFYGNSLPFNLVIIILYTSQTSRGYIQVTCITCNIS